MSYDEWVIEFGPVLNNITSEKLSTIYFGMYLFTENNGGLSYILSDNKTIPGHVWTLIGKKSNYKIIAGCHIKNRCGYFLTSERADKNIEVSL